MTDRPPRPVRAVLFDLDGTLTVPMLDFDAMRKEIGLSSSPLLEALEAMPEPERRRALAVIERHEQEAARASRLHPGARELLDFLRAKGIRTAVVTRNSRASVEIFSRKHGVRFDAVVTRDDAPPKPSPVPVLTALEQLGVGADEAIYVGDFEFDRIAGEAAGVRTYILLAHGRVRDAGPPERRVPSLAEILDLVRRANAS